MSDDARLRIIIDAFIQAKEDLQALEDDLNGVGEATERASEKTRESTEENTRAGLSLTDLKAGYDLLSEGLEKAKQLYDATIAKAAQWGDNMGDLAQVTGQSVEKTSEMAATLEVLGIGSDKYKAIIKSLTDEGLSFNLDTLIQLSEEYQAIQDPIEQNQFLFEKFGKAGVDMAEILGKDTDEMRRLGEAALTSGKVISGESAEAAEKWNILVAIMQQKAEGFAITLGNQVIPALVAYNEQLEANHADLVEQTTTLITTTQGYEDYVREVQRAEIAHGNLSPSTNALIASGRLLTEEMYNAARATGEMNTLTAEAERETRRLADAQVILDGGFSETYGTADVLANSFRELTAQTLYNQLAAGLDATASLELARSMGLVTNESYNAARQVQDLREKYDTNRDGAISAAEGAAEYTEEAKQLALALNAIPTVISTNYRISYTYSGNPNPAAGDIGLPGGSDGTYTPTPTQEITPVGGAYAQGGSFIVPGNGTQDQPYLVYMTPNEQVDITPPGQAPARGDTYYFQIDARGATDPGAVAQASYEGAKRALTEAGVKADLRIRMR